SAAANPPPPLKAEARYGPASRASASSISPEAASGSSTGTTDGSRVTDKRVGTRTFKAGSECAASRATNNSSLSVLDSLLTVNARTYNGLLYIVDPTFRTAG